MLLAVITAGDAECRAVVYLGRGAVTFTRGTWGHVRGNLREVGLATGPGRASSVADRALCSFVERRKRHLLGQKPSQRGVIQAG